MTDNAEYFGYQRDLFMKQLDHIQAIIGRLDDLIFKVKGWCVTVWVLMLGWGFRESFLSRWRFILLVLAIPIFFWLVAGTLKIHQRRFILLAKKASEFVNNNMKDAFKKKEFVSISPYDLGAKVPEKYSLRIRNCFFHENLFPLYLLLTLVSLLIPFLA